MESWGSVTFVNGPIRIYWMKEKIADKQNEQGGGRIQNLFVRAPEGIQYECSKQEEDEGDRILLRDIFF